MATPTRSRLVSASHTFLAFCFFASAKELIPEARRLSTILSHIFYSSILLFFFLFFSFETRVSWKRSNVTIGDARKSSRRRYMNLWPVRVAARVELKWYSIGSREFIALRYMRAYSNDRNFINGEKWNIRREQSFFFFFFKIVSRSIE